MKAINLCHGEPIDAHPGQPTTKSNSSPHAVKEIHRPPTAAEVASLTFDKLRDARIRTQSLSNEFARLLNRGSSLE